MFKPKGLFLFLILVVLGSGLMWWQQRGTTESAVPSIPTQPTILINDHTFRVEVADTDEKRTRGLSGRSEIGADGMLFIFDSPGQYGFWMKEMLFDLDFIWIRDGQVVDIHEQIPHSVSSDSTLPVYQPKQVVTQMLEVPAGTVEEFNIQIGDTVQYLSDEK